MKPSFIYLIGFVIIIILHALSDGFYCRSFTNSKKSNDKIFFHILSSLHIASWLIFIVICNDIYLMKIKWYFIIMMYVLLRFALFDVIWNIVNKKELFYTGNTSLYGKFWTDVEETTKWSKTQILFWLKLFSLLIAYSLTTY